MNESLEAVRTSLHAKNLNLEIECALDPEYKGMLSGEHTHYAPRDYSRIFRAYSAACLILNDNPDEVLIDSPAEIPENAPWLGSQLLKLLNGTLERQSQAAYQFRSKFRAKHTVCADTEDYFLEATGHKHGEIPQLENEQTVYTDDSGQPVLFTQGFKRVQSSISFADVSVQGVTLPAGTIFRTRKKVRFDQTTVKPGLNNANIKSISYLQPLRLSLFAIPHEERFEAATCQPLPEPVENDRRAFLDGLPAISMLDTYLRAELRKQKESAPQYATAAALASSR